jgi:hypothetical protein
MFIPSHSRNINDDLKKLFALWEEIFLYFTLLYTTFVKVHRYLDVSQPMQNAKESAMLKTRYAIRVPVRAAHK